MPVQLTPSFLLAGKADPPSPAFTGYHTGLGRPCRPPALVAANGGRAQRPSSRAWAFIACWEFMYLNILHAMYAAPMQPNKELGSLAAAGPSDLPQPVKCQAPAPPTLASAPAEPAVPLQPSAQQVVGQEGVGAAPAEVLPGADFFLESLVTGQPMAAPDVRLAGCLLLALCPSVQSGLEWIPWFGL